MAIADGDLSIATNGDIRWTGNGTTQYTVLELHRWLQDKADDALASGDDLLDISDTTPSDRSTDNIITLLSPYNIDDATAEHFYDGSITQSNGDVVYAGLVVVGSTEENADTALAAAIADDGGAFTDDTTAAGEATADDMTLLPATPAVNDAYYFGGNDPFKSLQLNISTAGAGSWTITWEYYNGSAYVALQNVTDNTSGFTAGTGEFDVTYDFPIDWAVDTVNAQGPFYYIRARVSAYTSITTQPLGQQADVTKGTHIQIVQNNALITNYWGPGINADAGANILLRTMVKTRTGGADTDGQRLRLQARELGNTYAEFLVTMGLGNNTAAIFTANDLNNATAESTISGWSTITNVTEGYNGLDVDGDTTNEFYYSEWDRDTFTINQLYERTKWLQRRGSASTLYGLNGELFRGITHEIDVDGPTGTFTPPESLSWGTGATAGTAQLLAIDSTTAATKIWIQLLTGVLPADNLTITGGSSSATVDADLTTGTITARTVSPAFVGASTGSAIIGAYGIGIETTDLTSSDQLFDLTNTLRVPPNNVQFTVLGLVSGEDYVLVTNDNGGAPDKAQMSLDVALTGATETVVDVDLIPVDTPQTGSIRVVTNAGIDKIVHYSSHTGNVFTMDSAHPDYATFRDFSGDNASATNNVYITYIDQLADSKVGVSAAISNESGVGFTDETTDANSAATGDVTLLPTGTDADEFYVGKNSIFNVVTFDIGTAGVGTYTVSWEYFNGSIWTALTVTDNTTSFKAGTGEFTVTFTPPSDWDTTTVNSQGPFYYIRAVADSGTRTTPPVGDQVFVQEQTTSESVTITYNADRTMFVRVRDGGSTPIKTFETTGTLGSSGGSSTVIRTSDA